MCRSVDLVYMPTVRSNKIIARARLRARAFFFTFSSGQVRLKEDLITERSLAMLIKVLIGVAGVLFLLGIIFVKRCFAQKALPGTISSWRESSYICRVYWPKEDKFQNGILGLEVNIQEGWWRLFQSAKFGIGEARSLIYRDGRPVIIVVLYDDIPVLGVPATYDRSTQEEGIRKVCAVMLMEAEWEGVVPSIYYRPCCLLGLANDNGFSSEG